MSVQSAADTGAVVRGLLAMVFCCLLWTQKVQKSSPFVDSYCVRVTLNGGCDAGLFIFSTPS
jgi:hypothetical protein